MKKENNLKEALLEQMNKDSSRASKFDPAASQAIIAKDVARLKLIRTFAMVSWLLLILSLAATAVAWAIVRSINAPLVVTLLLVSQLLLLIAVSLSGWHWARSRTLNMKQIQARLSEIQEQLNKMSHGQ
jgi:hypothetical protein